MHPDPSRPREPQPDIRPEAQPAANVGVGPRSLAGFFLRFLLIYGLLLAPWPGWREGYGRLFREMGQIFLGREVGQAGSGAVRFAGIPPEERRQLDTRIVLANPADPGAGGSGAGQILELDSRGIGWVPTALVTALILATPLPWRRRGVALLAGLGLIQVFILFSVSTSLWNALPPSAGWPRPIASLERHLTAALEDAFVTQLGASFVIPTVIWILVAFRRNDFRATPRPR